jgi:hypothetical protein
MQIVTDPGIPPEDKKLYLAATELCRKAAFGGGCYRDDGPAFRGALNSQSLTDAEKESLRTAMTKFAEYRKRSINGEPESPADFRQAFKLHYGLDDEDLATIDSGLAICDRLSLSRKCLSLLKVEILEKTYASQLQKNEISNFAMAQRLLENIKKVDENNERRREANRQLAIMGLQQSLNSWHYSTTNCTGFGVSIQCSSFGH